jgi:hypothetical protein
VDRIDGVNGQIEYLRQQGSFGTFTSSQAVVTVDGSRWRARVPEEFAACSRQMPSVDVGVHTIRRFHAVQRGRCGGDSGADERWGQPRWGMASLAKSAAETASRVRRVSSETACDGGATGRNRH